MEGRAWRGERGRAACHHPRIQAYRCVLVCGSLSHTHKSPLLPGPSMCGSCVALAWLVCVSFPPLRRPLNASRLMLTPIRSVPRTRSPSSPTRHPTLDCACDYGNEKEVGEGIRAALDAGTCTREELWVTSKLWNTFHAKEHVGAALRRSLDDLQLEYLDLYLIHFPIPLKSVWVVRCSPRTGYLVLPRTRPSQSLFPCAYYAVVGLIPPAPPSSLPLLLLTDPLPTPHFVFQKTGTSTPPPGTPRNGSTTQPPTHRP